jgi:hypothetical protein
VKPLQFRGGDGEQREVYIGGRWVYETEWLQVAGVLAKGQDPTTAPELTLLFADAPGDADAATAFWFDTSAMRH